MKKNKIGTVFLVSILALAGVGVSFAGFSDIITVYGSVSTATVEFEIAYSGTDVWKVYGTGAPEGEIVEWHGLSDDPDRPTKTSLEDLYPGCTVLLVASAWAMPGTNGHQVDVVYDNLFPCIGFKADIVAHYIGSIPAMVTISEPVWISGEDIFGNHLTFYYYVIEGNSVELPHQMHYCDTLTIDITIHLPQDNDLQGKSGAFSFDIEAIQWNDECNGQQTPDKTDVILPDGIVTAGFLNWGPQSYWDVWIKNLPAGGPYSPPLNNPIPIRCVGWCVDEVGKIYGDNRSYTFNMMSSYNPMNPWPGNHAPAEDYDWPCVNWIINNKAGYTKVEIQDAIWYFVDGGVNPGGNAGDLIQAALDNGKNFIPQTGQNVAVLLIADPPGQHNQVVQKVFIEVDP